MTLKIKNIKTSIIGKPVKGNNSQIGYQIQKMLKQEGWTVQNGAGPDILYEGIEIKSRNINATSNQTICSMTKDDIIALPYEFSPIKDKIQYQIRVYHDGKKIITARLYNFSDDYIQDKISQAYEEARKKLKNDWTKNWVPGNYWGSFEKVNKSKNLYEFRLTPGAYSKLESLSTNNFSDIFISV